jgi:hypothetical protein
VTLSRDVRQGELRLASSDEVLAKAASSTSLTSSDLFRQAVPQAADAQALLFVDLTKIWTFDNLDPGSDEWKQLAAVGATTRDDGDRSSLVVRLVLR